MKQQNALKLPGKEYLCNRFTNCIVHRVGAAWAGGTSACGSVCTCISEINQFIKVKCLAKQNGHNHLLRVVLVQCECSASVVQV